MLSICVCVSHSHATSKEKAALCLLRHTYIQTCIHTYSDVQKILLSSHSHATSKKKAALCLLRLLRKYPEGFGEDGISGMPDQRDKLLDLLVCMHYMYIYIHVYICMYTCLCVYMYLYTCNMYVLRGGLWRRACRIRETSCLTCWYVCVMRAGVYTEYVCVYTCICTYISIHI